MRDLISVPLSAWSEKNEKGMSLILRTILSALFFLILCQPELSAQDKEPARYRIVFYNTENLFDPFDDPATNDQEFTPSGKNHWTIGKLNEKVMMVYRAIISASAGHYPDIIGLAEIENLWIIEYLLRKTPLKEGNYGIIHKESPDPRGIDVALLYRKETIIPLDFDFIPVHGKGKKTFNSRDILHFKGGLGNETVNFLVNHWPSRSGGYTETKGKRNIAAGIERRAIDSIMTQTPHSKFLLMGDFNATPEETCLSRILGASMNIENSGSSGLINLSQFWTDKGLGTIRSKGHWEIFDQFICSGNLFDTNNLRVEPSETKICTADILMEDDRRYLGKKPFRAFLGPVYHGGVSDHLPISTVIVHKK